MWNVLPAIPVATLGIAAAAGLHTTPRLQPMRRWLPLLAAVPALAAALLALALTSQANAPALAMPIPGWPAKLFASAPTLSLDAAGAWSLALLSVLAVLVAIRALRSESPTDVWGRAFAVAAAAALFIALLRSSIGLLLAWAFMDGVIYLVAGRRRRGLLVGQLGLLAAVVGLATLPAAGLGAPTALSASAVVARPWLFAAAAIRMGVFPLWWTVPSARRDHLWGSALLRVAPTLAGAYLLIEASALSAAGSGLFFGMTLPVAAVGMGAVMTLVAPRHGRALDWATTYVASLVLVAATLGGAAGRAAALLLTAELVVGRGGAYLVPPVRRRADGLAHLGLLAALAGVPPLLGFLGRWVVYTELLARGMVGTFVAILFATGLVVAGAHRGRRDGVRPPPPIGPPALPAPRRPGRVPTATAALLALTLEVVLGLVVPVVAARLGTGAVAEIPNPLMELLHAPTATAALLAGALLLPVVLALVLGRLLDERLRTANPGSTWDLTAVLDAVGGGVIRVGALLEHASGLVEGRRAMAWTLLAMVGLALVPLATPAAPPEALHVWLFLLATGLGAGLVLLTRADWTLGTLGLVYLFVAADLFASDTPVVLPLIKLITGACVVTILAISVVQTPVDRRLIQASERLAALRGISEPSPRLVPGLAVVTAGVILFGVHSVVAPKALSDAVLQPALTLAAAGALTVVFARTPLRLAAGALAILTAFELAYARLDPGLVVTGGLAVFQLLFAIVASYFVGGGDAQP